MARVILPVSAALPLRSIYRLPLPMQAGPEGSAELGTPLLHSLLMKDHFLLGTHYPSYPVISLVPHSRSEWVQGSSFVPAPTLAALCVLWFPGPSLYRPAGLVRGQECSTFSKAFLRAFLPAGLCRPSLLSPDSFPTFRCKAKGKELIQRLLDLRRASFMSLPAVSSL